MGGIGAFTGAAAKGVGAAIIGGATVGTGVGEISQASKDAGLLKYLG